MNRHPNSEMGTKSVLPIVEFGDAPLSIEQVVSVAEHSRRVALTVNTEALQRLNKGVEFLDQLLSVQGTIYGVTTGYGDSCTVAVPYPEYEELPYHLVRFHGCGLGNLFGDTEARAILSARLASLARGYSGVRPRLLQQIVDCLNHGVVPCIPEEGSVGASGDLTPLSYVAAMLIGEREVLFKGQVRKATEVLAEVGIEPIDLRPKEALAIMNGTAVMTGLACLAFHRASYLSRLCARITALNLVALKGNDYHFDAGLFAVKPHPGQARVAAWLRQDLAADAAPANPERLQDRYSLRCAPHVIGVLEDAFPMLRSFIENELNSANDNPIIDGEGGHVWHGGHFYGGHIAFAMDSLKNCVANLADLLDRQMAQLMDTRFNNGLPANLSGAQGNRKPINHGFKAVQISTSALTAEALKLTMPASVFSRSTECHNQDKVSMGTIAARDCLRVLQLTEQVAACVLFAGCQGFTLRVRQGDARPHNVTPELRSFTGKIMQQCGFVEEDRALDLTLRELVQQIQSRAWNLES